MNLTLIFSKILELRRGWNLGPPGKGSRIIETSTYHQECRESFQLCQPNFISHFDRLLDKETKFNRPSVRNLQESPKISLHVI